MSRTKQRRAWLVTKVLAGELTVAEAAPLLALGERQVWRLLAAMRRTGPAGLVHGNRGRASPRRLPDPVRERILALARDRYAGVNDSHLAELLAEEEQIHIERLWGTAQDRLVSELRLAEASTLDEANAVLAAFVPRFNRRFGVPPLDAASAWRPAPPPKALARICCLKHVRVVANDHTVRAGATIVQLPPRSDRRSYAGTRVEPQHHLDGRLVVWDGERELHSQRADVAQMAAMAGTRAKLGTLPPSARTAVKPAANHPWRRMAIGRNKGRGVTESPNR